MREIKIIMHSPIMIAFHLVENNEATRSEPYKVYINDIVWSADSLILKTSLGVYSAAEAYSEVMDRIRTETHDMNLQAPDDLLCYIPRLSYNL